MKICLINSLYPPYTRGGAERVVEETARVLAARGNEVIVISTTGYRLPVTGSKNENNIRVFRVASANVCSFYNYSEKILPVRLLWLAIDLVNPIVAWRVHKILETEKPDVVHTHNLRGLSYLIPRVIKKYYETLPFDYAQGKLAQGDTGKVKHVHTLHDIQYAYPSGLLIHGKENTWYNRFFLRKWYERICKWLLGSPSVVTAPSQWLLDFYTKRGFFGSSEKVVLRNPAVKTENPKLKTLNKSQIQNNKAQNISLLFIGQIEEHKGILFLINSIKKLPVTSYPRLPSASPQANGGQELPVTIVGDGHEMDTVKKLTQDDDRFTITGRLSPADTSQYYQNADMVVVPSLTYENAPAVITEAHAYGAPVLASRIGGIPEMIDEGKNGWLFEPENYDSFQTKLKVALDDIQNGNIHMIYDGSQKYSNNTYIESLEKLYTK